MPGQPFDYVGPPLNRTRLAQLLDERGVSRHDYRLYGSDAVDGFLMDHGPDGWTIAYVERGSRSMVQTLASEEDACRAFLVVFLPYLTRA